MEKEDINPKLEGANIIDCIPQVGECPNNCLECFYNKRVKAKGPLTPALTPYYYNSEGFFRTKDKPLIPSLADVGEKIVRVNSGHDSNIQKDLVLKTTEQYVKKFYCTSLPYFDFPGPVVFTCNGRDTDKSFLCVTDNLWNLMMVRFRTDMWNQELLDAAILYYTYENQIPFTITFMRYSDIENIPLSYRDHYEIRISILNEYYCLKKECQKEIVSRYSCFSNFVAMCGTFESPLCRNCGRCERCYDRIMKNESSY